MSGVTDITARNSSHHVVTDSDGVIRPMEGLRAFQLSSSDPLYTAPLELVSLPISRFSQEGRGRRRRLERGYDLSRCFGKTYTLRPLYHLFNPNEDDVLMSTAAAELLDEMGADELSSRYDHWVIDLSGELGGGSEGYEGTLLDPSAWGWPLMCERPYRKFTGSVVSLSALPQAKIELLRLLESQGRLLGFKIRVERISTPTSILISGHRSTSDTEAEAELESDANSSLRPGFTIGEIQRGITVVRDHLRLHGGSKSLGYMRGEMSLDGEGEWREAGGDIRSGGYRKGEDARLGSGAQRDVIEVGQVSKYSIRGCTVC